jgi:hypothetical protein
MNFLCHYGINLYVFRGGGGREGEEVENRGGTGGEREGRESEEQEEAKRSEPLIRWNTKFQPFQDYKSSLFDFRLCKYKNKYPIN